MAGPVGGSGPLWQRAIWLFICCSIALALWNGFAGNDPSTIYDRLQHKSEEVRDTAENLGKKIENGIPSAPGTKKAPNAPHKGANHGQSQRQAPRTGNQ